ncbi:MAG TPA: hypothetical protein VG323_20980 [Thermoanaerobaculia bacterium]|nr:hypothetical protein [Thermoanaerobaculia bacterium]
MKTTLAALAWMATAGCGAMFHGATQSIPVNSTPPAATARATCNDGSAVEATTPGTLLLRRNAEGCTITVSKAEYESQTVALARGKSGSMIANVPASIGSALGGALVGLIVCSRGSSNTAGDCAGAGALLGLLVPGYVDARTGAMYTQRPERVEVTLRSAK